MPSETPEPLEPQPSHASDPIDIRSKGDISRIMAPGTDKHQPLPGFDDDYVDIVDYILRCTHKIWEEKAMGLIYSHYQHNVKVHTAQGTSYGREQVVADSIQHLAAFPDRKLYGDEVIWAGNGHEGFHTSHRIVTVAHNTGYSVYGAPTGKRVVYRTIANCVVKENRIVEEWLVRDQLSIIQQLGLPVDEVVAKLAAVPSAATPPTAQPEQRRALGQNAPAPYQAQHSGFDIEDFVRQHWHDIWNRRLFNSIDRYYAAGYACHTVSNRSLYGREELCMFIVALIAMFPDARLDIDDVYALGNPQEGYRVALRWSLSGSHTGYGVYGAPTGKRVRIMGITHQRVVAETFVEEWTVFDELALLVQLARPAQ